MSKKDKKVQAATVESNAAPEVKTAFGKPVAPKRVVTRADGFE